MLFRVEPASGQLIILFTLECGLRTATAQFLLCHAQCHDREPRANRVLIAKCAKADNRVQENLLHDVVDIVLLTQHAVRHSGDIAAVKAKGGGRGRPLRFRRAIQRAVDVRATTHTKWCEPNHVESVLWNPWPGSTLPTKTVFK